jgi:hypothetical protein
MPRFIVTIFWIGLSVAVLYYGSIWGREYYKIKMAETCTQRMWLIEEAKQKFAKDFPHRNPDTHSELLAYIPFTGFPMCPYGGEFGNCLTLENKTTCSLNGDPEYEPNTPGVDLKRNGFMDLEKKRDSVTFYEFFHDRVSWKDTEKDPLSAKEKKKKALFGTQ